jgi:NAD(P)-dependent dehydrogenase (short-subunit alcohol dehydrogenase family)
VPPTEPFGETTVIVTGPTAGIGAAVAEHLIRKGARIVGVARRDEPGKALVARFDGAFRFIAGDVRDQATAIQAVDAALEWTGRLDGLVNNAALDFTSDLLDATPQEITELFAVNSIGPIYMLQEAARAMKREGNGGAIVNVSSRLASNGVPTMAVYGATKGAVEALTLGAAVELAPANIRVNAVAPGLTQTPLFDDWLRRQPDPDGWKQRSLRAIPQGRFGRPEEVAALIAFLLSSEAAHITGAVIPIDGGFQAG